MKPFGESHLGNAVCSECNMSKDSLITRIRKSKNQAQIKELLVKDNPFTIQCRCTKKSS